MDFAGFANDYAAEEESKARELYQKAVDTANDPLEYQNIAMLVEEYLGDSKWAEEIKEIAPLNTIFIRANGECAYNGVSGHPCRLSSDSLRRDIFCNSILA